MMTPSVALSMGTRDEPVVHEPWNSDWTGAIVAKCADEPGDKMVCLCVTTPR
jgi:hypothetical protein